MSDDIDDGAFDASDSVDWPEPAYQDFVAERADAFGNLALKLGMIQDDKVKELGLAMLRTIIRSVKTPPGAELTEIPKG